MKFNKSLSLFGVVCVFLVGYQFMGAALWTPPNVAPPNNNTDAPVNIGADTQNKVGNLKANIFAAGTQMWSDLYCDSLGQNCFNPATVVSPGACPAGEFITEIRPNGNIKCATPAGGSTNCVLQQKSVSACVYQSSSVPGCPAGYNAVSLTQGGSCSTNNYTWTRLCQKVVCS